MWPIVVWIMKTETLWFWHVVYLSAWEEMLWQARVHRYNGRVCTGCLEIRQFMALRSDRLADLAALCCISTALMKWGLKLTKEHTCLPMTLRCESQVRQECALKRATKDKKHKLKPGLSQYQIFTMRLLWLKEFIITILSWHLFKNETFFFDLEISLCSLGNGMCFCSMLK